MVFIWEVFGFADRHGGDYNPSLPYDVNGHQRSAGHILVSLKGDKFKPGKRK
ncbi:hypothetical protein PHJA_001367200 [Phtheirospermum japonicum]|uniref:Uncharacterized protein n=1 Tax=Phtheirospermum japonicum TaxID=374723 RepID=A0A830CD97_9LAMI|nr:hypothetical protein PHJA_001367200 [Phtheirospermum japonicum]